MSVQPEIDLEVIMHIWRYLFMVKVLVKRIKVKGQILMICIVPGYFDANFQLLVLEEIMVKWKG